MLQAELFGRVRMNFIRVSFAAALLVASVSGPAGTTTPQPQQIFYRALLGKQIAIQAAAKDGSNISTVFKTNGSINFDVGSQDSGVIAVSTDSAFLLLHYVKSGSQYVLSGSPQTLLTGFTRATSLDLSPDGTRIAYRGGDGNHLMVYTVGDSAPVEWDSGKFVWDLAWARGGASLIYLDHAPSGLTHLYEVTGPGQVSDVLDKPYMDRVEVSRLDGSKLLLSYNSDDGQQTFVGTWRLPTTNPDGTPNPGAWVAPALAGGGTAVANRGVLSCDDSYLIYGSSGHAGAQIWYTRNLLSGADVLINKVPANAEPQSWSSCATAATQTNDAFEFRTVSH
jgi:hypothetical protein